MKLKTRYVKPLLKVMLLLLTLQLIACHSKQIILQDSATMKIHKGDLPKSPESEGWLLSNQAVIKLIEAAEKCQ